MEEGLMPREIWFRSQGAALFALEDGEPQGRPLVMLHGGLATSAASLAAAFERMDALGRRAPAEGMEVMRPLFDGAPIAFREAALQMMAALDPASTAAATAFYASGAQPFDSPEDLRRISARSVLVPGS